MHFAELDMLRWAHILSMVYWLGGEWGVFQTSYNVTNGALSLDERRRHMETAYRIDILARTGIVLLLPLGLHMGHIYGFAPFLDGMLAVMWLFFAAWLGLTWSAFLTRETDRGIRLTKIEEWLRYGMIAAIFYFGATSWMGQGPFVVGEGTYWYPAKFILYGFTLIIGLFLRVIMRRWTTRFRKIAETGDAAEQAALEKEIGYARYAAYLYWITISGICFLGATKPF
ncbi:MAG: hypothetical protein RLZZ58_903 [Pseudomonadota bacterium]|jgi:hypothetical protein